MARLILSPIAGPLVLGSSDNPLIVAGSGAVVSTGSGADGIDGSAGTAWLIVNQGSVSSSSGKGIALGGPGFLENSGQVAGRTAVDIGGFGIIANSGVVSGSLAVEIGGFGAIVNTATIAGGYGIEIGGFGWIDNSGQIVGGVQAGQGGLVTNDGHITYGVSADGVVIAGGSGRVVNGGTIDGYGVAVSLGAGGSVFNGSGGLIRSPRFAVSIAGGGTVLNLGSIQGGEFSGINISGGAGTVFNGGSISGINGVSLGSGGTVMNRGVIRGESAIVVSGGAGSITNDGTISGFYGAISLADGGTVINRGSIGGEVVIGGGSGTIDTNGIMAPSETLHGNVIVSFGSASADNLLVIHPGAQFLGVADATSGTGSRIELAQGTGTISGIGSGQFNGFDTLVVDHRANWTLAGSNTAATVLDDGSVRVSGALDVSEAVDQASTGMFQLLGPSTLEIAAAVGTGSAIRFQAGSDLVVDDFQLFGTHVGTASYAGPLLDQFGGATIDLRDFSAGGISSSFSNATGLLQLTNASSQKATLEFQASSLGSGTFQFAGDGAAGVLITHA